MDVVHYSATGFEDHPRPQPRLEYELFATRAGFLMIRLADLSPRCARAVDDAAGSRKWRSKLRGVTSAFLIQAPPSGGWRARSQINQVFEAVHAGALRCRAVRVLPIKEHDHER